MAERLPQDPRLKSTMPQDPRLKSTMPQDPRLKSTMPQDPRLKSTMVRSSSLCLPGQSSTTGRLPQDPRLESTMLRSSSLCLPGQSSPTGRLPQDPRLKSTMLRSSSLCLPGQSSTTVLSGSTQVVHFGDTFMLLKGKSRTSQENKKRIHNFHAYVNACDDSGGLTMQTMVVCDGRFLFPCTIIVGCLLCWQCDYECIVYFSC